MNAGADSQNWGGYVEKTPEPPPGVFEIGLVLPGAVSAGAYTGGVIDFLVEALDAWEAEKRRCAANESDPRKWPIPGHQVRLRVVSGASSGAMIGAIMAVALKYNFPHVRGTATAPSNPLYTPCVEDIDIFKLLRRDDLAESQGPVVSVLDSSALVDSLSSALNYRGPPAPPRPYLDPAVRFILTEGNLRGIPYFLKMRGNVLAGLGMRCHSDWQSFYVTYGAGAPACRADDVTLQFPNSASAPDWRQLLIAALASGAFPIGFAPRLIERTASDYDYRFCVVPGDGVKPAMVVRLQPAWPRGNPIPAPYRSLAVDGGTMDNEPLELARMDLAGLLGRNPRSGDLATRATLLIDPFPDLAGAVDPGEQPGADLLHIAVGLMTSWRDQARFNPTDLALAGDKETYSRFLLAPNRGASPESNGFALACGALGGFSGYLAKRYREHDFELGRLNCQQFLQNDFCLPVSNQPVFGMVNPELKQPGSPWVAPGPGPLSLPIIPLISSLKETPPMPVWPPKDVFDPETLRDAAGARLDAVVERILQDSIQLNWFYALLAKFALWRVRKVAIDKVIEITSQQLRERALL
jgi:hypothetical protein